MSYISREDFEALWIECVRLLPTYGFEFKKVDVHPSVLDAFESCFEVVARVQKENPPAKLPLPSGFTPETLDIITLEMGLSAIRRGIAGFQYNECLNGLREGIRKVIETMGYEKPQAIYTRKWQSYKRWEDLVRAAGMNEEGIEAAREKYLHGYTV